MHVPATSKIGSDSEGQFRTNKNFSQFSSKNAPKKNPQKGTIKYTLKKGFLYSFTPIQVYFPIINF